MLDKGLAGDGLDGGLYVVVDGVDGRTHYVETSDDAKLDEVRRGHIVALEPVTSKAEPRAADLNIRDMRPSTAASTGRASIWKRLGPRSSASRAILTPSSDRMYAGSAGPRVEHLSLRPARIDRNGKACCHASNRQSFDIAERGQSCSRS
ncbi:DUF3363 domain-containing protein [Mesorhizobium tamadayense]|uniref:DUF3363 domain-containing protein n=1 Tax=Mesorhizobium tamadayense TaxID=425306 RepID=UPI001FE10775|nr:DUF3363 domain-containing protein [Mesorhizobium tamadayense]